MSRQDELSTEREHRQDRHHETYEEEHWTVVGISGVDKTFATDVSGGNNPEAVRVDLDGYGAGNAIEDIGEEDENVNASIWLPLPEAAELAEQLTEAVEDARK